MAAFCITVTYLPYIQAFGPDNPGNLGKIASASDFAIFSHAAFNHTDSIPETPAALPDDFSLLKRDNSAWSFRLLQLAANL